MSHFIAHALRLHSPATSLCWVSQWLIANICMESVNEGNKAVLVFVLFSFPQPDSIKNKYIKGYLAECLRLEQTPTNFYFS